MRARVGADDDTFVFLSVGGVEPRKGSRYLFEALGLLKRATARRVVLAVMGGQSFQDYADYRERALASLPGLGLSLDEDVRLLGTVPDEEVPHWYAAADALAFPSLKEGWGLAVLEGLAAGLPVVATDLPVFREYLTPGQSALLVPPEDAAALARAMLVLVEDRTMAAHLAAHAPAIVSRFSWKATALRHRAIYADVRERKTVRLCQADQRCVRAPPPTCRPSGRRCSGGNISMAAPEAFLNDYCVVGTDSGGARGEHDC